MGSEARRGDGSLSSWALRGGHRVRNEFRVQRLNAIEQRLRDRLLRCAGRRNRGEVRDRLQRVFPRQIRIVRRRGTSISSLDGPSVLRPEVLCDGFPVAQKQSSLALLFHLVVIGAGDVRAAGSREHPAVIRLEPAPVRAWIRPSTIEVFLKTGVVRADGREHGRSSCLPRRASRVHTAAPGCDAAALRGEFGLAAYGKTRSRPDGSGCACTGGTRVPPSPNGE